MQGNTKKKLAYGLIISDFDGTLVSSDGTVCQQNKDSIEKYCQSGGKFVISTGRMHYGIMPRVKELGLKGLVSCAHGAFIIDAGTGEVLFSHTIPAETVACICEKMEELDLNFNVYTKDVYYANRVSERLQRYENALKVKAVMVEDKPLSQFVRENGICAYNVLAFVDPADNERIMAKLSEHVFEGCIITKSSDSLVEAVSASCSKGTALEFLAEHYSIPREEVIAVGDQWNDISMIEAAGLGIAVKNANDRLKEKAVTLEYTNNEGAVSHIIERYAYSALFGYSYV